MRGTRDVPRWWRGVALCWGLLGGAGAYAFQSPLPGFVPDIADHADLAPLKQDACSAQILARLNRTLHQKFAVADLATYFDRNTGRTVRGFLRGGAWNVRVVKAGLIYAEARHLKPGRSTSLASIFEDGLGRSVHLPEHIGHQTVFYKQKDKAVGLWTVDLTVHIDDGYPYLPLGFIWHWFRDIELSHSRNPCP